jgi:uncharacterized lipoprotein YddW (UPF0748 family)
MSMVHRVALFAPLVFLLLSLTCWQVEAAPSAADGRTFVGKLAILDGDIPNWVDKDYVDRALQRIKEAGFNVYIPTVWQGRGTAWPSQHAPWDSHLANIPKAGFDPLRYLIAKAHQMGIEVHPWLTLTLRQGDLFPEFVPPGTPEGAFDVHNEKFRRLMANLVGEVVERYDVDGINLDYVRAVGLCQTESCRREYREKYGRNLDVDIALFKATFGRVPTLVAYQESAVSAMMTAVTEEIRKRKPHLLISIDALVGEIGPEQGQRSLEWVNQGLVDVVFRMDYMRQINLQIAESARHQLNNPDAFGLMLSNMSTFEEMAPGQKHFARDGKWLAETVSMIRSRWPRAGLAVYFYKYLTDEQIAALKRRAVPKPVNLEDVTVY